MPLIKKASKKAFEHNLKAEMHAGKPQDQSLAIAYDVQRRNKKAHGGKIEQESLPEHDSPEHEQKESAKHEIAEHYESIADAILAKKRKHMAEGGEVDHNAEEGPAVHDDFNFEAADEDIYDDSQLSAQPIDSNEHGDEIEHDKHDMIDAIRKKMKKSF